MTKAKFQGKPMIEIPEFVPSICFLEGDFGKEVSKEVDSRYKGFNAVKGIGSYSNGGVVQGSNPFYAVAVNEVIRSEGLRTATQADLEKAIKTGVLPLRGQYEDTGLVLRTEGEPNSYLASHLMKQVKARESKRMPVMIPLAGLDLEKDSNSPYGLAFKLRDDVELIYAPILKKFGSHFSSADIDEKTGLPKKLREGWRYLSTRKKGLSRLIIGSILGEIYSKVGDLQESYDDGRVVVIAPEAQEINSLEGKL